MKNPLSFIICATLFLAGFLPATTLAQDNQGHHLSGVTGQVNGGIFGSGMVLPGHVRIYSDEGELVVEVETEVQGNTLWHFEVFLKPGHYTLVAYAGAPPENGGILYSFPVPVTVNKKQFTEVAISFRPV
jgi:hypothetical protein